MVDTYDTGQERFYFIDETVPGTTPANPAMLGGIASNIVPSFDPQNIDVRGVGSYDALSIKRGTRRASLRLDYVIPSSAPLSLLQYAKRELDKTLSGQVIYHKNAFATATDIISLVYTYLKVNKVTVSCEIDDVIRVSMDLLGQNVVTGTGKIAGATYTDHTGAVAFDEVNVTIGGSVNSRVCSWSFNIDNALKLVPVVRATTGYLPKYVCWGQRTLSGTVNFEFESKQEIDEALADTAQTISFGLGGATAATFSGCKWGNISKEKWLEDLIQVKAPFTATGLTID